MKAAYAANDRVRGEGGRNLVEAVRAAEHPPLRDPERGVLPPADRAARAARRGHAAVDRRAGDDRRRGGGRRAGRAGGAGGRRRGAPLRLLRRAGHVVRRATAAIGELVRKRRYPLVGEGAGVHSFVHVDDAAAATHRGPRRAERRLQRRRRPSRADPRVAPGVRRRARRPAAAAPARGAAEGARRGAPWWRGRRASRERATPARRRPSTGHPSTRPGGPPSATRKVPPWRASRDRGTSTNAGSARRSATA